jgi:hypothetical protein
MMVSPTWTNCRDPPRIVVASPALTTFTLVTAKLDSALTAEEATRVTSYSVPTTSAYAGSLKTAGFWEEERAPISTVKVALSKILEAIVHLNMMLLYDLTPEQGSVNAFEFSTSASFLRILTAAGPRMLAMGTSLSDDVTNTDLEADAQASRKLQSVIWRLYR